MGIIKRRWRGWLLAIVTMAAAAVAAEKPKPAKLGITGVGWWRDRELTVSLERLLGAERGEEIGPDGLEDAAYLLYSAMTEQGFLHPSMAIETEDRDGRKGHLDVANLEELSVPRDLRVRAAKFVLKPGIRYYLSEVVIRGIHAMSEERARTYFMPGNSLFVGRAARKYTPASLQRSTQALQTALTQEGYGEAKVRVENLQVDDSTGEVRVTVGVDEGPKWEVRQLTIEGNEPSALAFSRLEHTWVPRPWSEFWRQDVTEEVRRLYFKYGYPDVKARVEIGEPEGVGQLKTVTATARVDAGERVRMGKVRFRGLVRTQEQVLRRRVGLHEGQWLNPLALERAKFQLTRLDVFDSVDVETEPTDGAVREVIFDVKEAQRWELNSSLGFGSYDKLRLGLEVKERNIFGRGHESRLDLLQSFKMSRADYTYSVPEIFGESVDGSARLFGLRRKEVAFLRQEFGVDVTFKRTIRRWGLDATAGYTLQRLQNQQNQLATRAVDRRQVTVGALEFGLFRDRRDHPLRPTRGYRFFVQGELASRLFGGEVEYQRIEAGGSYHWSWGNGQSVHVGLRHGAVAQLWGRTTLPVNKRFYPGGDESIRGYSEGEASPRDLDGLFNGAKSYALANVEFEQAVTAKWAAVAFFDALGTAVNLNKYPFDQHLYSVGLGVRYHTLLGPVRLEYGRNIHPRPGDARGAWHLALGFPF